MIEPSDVSFSPASWEQPTATIRVVKVGRKAKLTSKLPPSMSMENVLFDMGFQEVFNSCLDNAHTQSLQCC